MAVNTDITTLSQNASLNGPAGTDPPSSLDNAIRNALAFIAQHRDGVGFNPGAIYTALGFTPIRQGGALGMNNNMIRIGWDGTSRLRLAVDNTDFSDDWPIDIVGNASTAGSATSAASATYATKAGSADSATNASTVGGVAVGELVRRGTQNAFTISWDGTRANILVDGSVQAARTTWVNVDNRPSDLAAFTNGPGYVQRGTASTLDVGAPDESGVVGRAIPNTDNRIRYINAISGGLGVVVDGTAYSWPINASDERLKKNIVPTREDSLAKIERIQFKAFDFTDELPVFAGISRKAGVVAQQIKQIDPDWVSSEGDYLQLNTETLLTSAMHAIQQLSAEVKALREGKP